MEALTSDQFKEILDFVQKYHKFALWMSDEEFKERNNVYFNMGKFGAHGMNIKYIDSCYDSRDAKIWSITFRINIHHKYTFSSNSFALKGKPKSLNRWNSMYDLCMAFIKGEMSDKQAKIFLDEQKD